MMKEDIFALPPSIHRENIRNYLGNKRWKKITDQVRKNANYTCGSCDTNMKDDIAHLHSHEDWLLDFDSKIAELTGIRALCDYCHMFHHQGLYGVHRIKGIIDDEKDKIIRHHWKTYPQEGYKIIISEENKKFINTIFNSDDWTIKPFDTLIDNIMRNSGQKTMLNTWD